MNTHQPPIQNKESDLLNGLLHRFLPYWPLFAALVIFLGAAAGIYLKYTTPVYQITASLMLQDKTKGVEDSKVADFLNIYNSKKIVENEIEVIHSRALMKEVVNSLYLYAPLYEEGQGKKLSAYTSSPVMIEAQEPESIKEFKKIPFTYHSNYGVRINNQTYVLNRWVNTPYGVLRFMPNAHRKQSTGNPLYFSLLLPKEVVDDMLKKLVVTEVSKLSTVVDLSFKDEVPERGENILNGITAAYNRAVVNDKNILASNTLAFVESRLKIVAAGLDSIERTIQQYKSKNGAVDVSEQGRLYLESVSTNDRKVADINTQLAVLNQVENYVVSKNSAKGIVPATLGVDDPVLKQLLQRLSEAELQYENLHQTIPENNSILTSLAKEIDQIRPRILENIHNQQVSMQAGRNNMTSAGNTYSAGLQTLPSKERKLLEISRQQSIESNVYSFLLQKREEMALSNAGTVADNRIIDTGESSVKPVSPKKWLVCLIALFGALGIGIAIILARESLSGKILFRSDIETLTSIPVTAEIANTAGTHGLISARPENGFVAEQFRQLGATLGLFTKASSSVKKLMVTSAIAGEGKSFVAANLALSLASSGKKVVLLDLDLRNPGASSLFNVQPANGMSEYLAGKANIQEIIRKSEYHNLSVIPAGKAVSNSMELLLTGNLSGLFSYLEEQFDYVLIDTSPVAPVTDATVIAEYCDKVLFVVRHGFSLKSMIRLLDDNQKIQSMRDIGIVFNGVKKRGFIQGSYGYGYGFGYEYVYREREQAKSLQRSF